MGKNRLIPEKYWSKFIITDSKTNAVMHDGHKFEELVKCLLSLMYSDIEWEATKMTHDGNKDFKAKNGEEIYWAECKNYKTKIDLKTLAATLVMAEIENVNLILFFCYSEINNSTKTKLNSYSKSAQKSIFFFDGIILDQLILKYKETVFPLFFPNLQDNISNMNIIINETKPTVLCYLERNPFFNGVPEFDMQDLVELQNLKLGEIIGIHIIFINNNLNKTVKCAIELNLLDSRNYFEILDNEVNKSNNNIMYHEIELLAGETKRKSIYLKLFNWAPKVSIPKIVCKYGRRQIKTFTFPLITTLRTRQTSFLGSNYINTVKKICKTISHQKRLSIIFLYGNSGTGKSRMISECSNKFISQGYNIIKLTNSKRTKHSAFVMLKELIFSLYGFSDEIIELILQNSYETLENYKYNNYKEIFKILKSMYNNCNPLLQKESLDYSIIFEKMAKEKIFFVIDDVQYWDTEAIRFLRDFVQYTSSMQRKCNTILGIAANTDFLYDQEIIEFLTELLTKCNSYGDSISSYNLAGFETVNQALLFLKEILGIEDDFSNIIDLPHLSLNPKYLTELANYLQDINAIEVIDNKVIITNKSLFQESLKKISLKIQVILEQRWSLFLENSKGHENLYKNIICSFLLLESVHINQDSFGIFHKNEIEKLYQYHFLKSDDSDNNIYVIEHDSIKIYFQKKYTDWMKTAVSYLEEFEQNYFKNHQLENIYQLFKKTIITFEDYCNIRNLDCSKNIKDELYEYILYFILSNSTDEFYKIIQDILYQSRECYGEKRAETLYKIFNKNYNPKSNRLSFYEYYDIMMGCAENQIKLKSTGRAIEIYNLLLRKIDDTPSPKQNYLRAKIYNRYFVCGRVGGNILQYSEKLNLSMNLVRQGRYCDICIENYFDKAQSLFLMENAERKIIECLTKGCCNYENHPVKHLKGHYLYRSIQLYFLKKEYKVLPEKIWQYDEEITNDNNIKYKLFFHIQFIIFKIIICLLGEKEYTDFEMENMLEQLNVYQTMQNTLQLYRYYYLSGKYYAQKKDWSKAYLFYQKTFDNLAENRNTEEIRLQRKYIIMDMLINFKKINFPFHKYDFSSFKVLVEDFSADNIILMSKEDFKKYFHNYRPLMPIFNKKTKEGFLLF